jgi:hypothetical protein
MPILGTVASQFAGKPFGSFDLISTAQGNGSSPVITFSDLNLLTEYKHLQIRTVMEQNVTTDWRGVYMRFNSDSGTNYWWNQLYNSNDTFGKAMSNQNFAICGNASGTQYRPGVSIIDIIDFSDNAKYKTILANEANIRYTTPRYIGWSSTQWRNTNAITSISFTVNADNFTTATLISLYGIKG